MQTKYYFLYTLVLVLLLGACRKDNTEIETIVETPEPEVYIETDLEGLIVDVDGNPIEGAEITLLNTSASSDQNGRFKINATTDANRAALSIRKEGFFSHYPVINPTGKGTDRIEVTLHPKVLAYQFNAIQGGAFELSNGSGVNFQANSIIDGSGATYQGAVNVYAQYIDPSADDYQEIMPGNLEALDTQDEYRALESFGMLRVELEDASGNPLQINEPAILTISVPQSLESNAPTTIPLWHYDETSGLWIEEGEANLEGGVYTGEVNHFSFWNCDVPIDFVYLDGKVLINGFETSAKVCITNIASGITMCTLTDDKGNFEGWVPNDQLLELTVYNDCSEAIYTEQIGPYSTDVSLPTLEITAPDQIYVDISGIIVNCDNEPLESGYIIVQGNNGGNVDFFDVASDGTVEGSFIVCSSTEIIVRAFDSQSLVISDPVSFPVSSAIDLGQLPACGNDLGLGVYITSPEINDYLESDNTFTTTISSTTGDPYIFEYNLVANYNNGQVVYTFHFVNWTESLADPLWAVSTTQQIIDTPDDIYWIDGQEIIFSAPEGVDPGSLVTFDLIDCNISEEISNTSSTGSVTIVGFIED